MAEKSKGGRKNRKYGRSKAWCEAYARSGREGINRKRRLRTTLKYQPNNIALVARYESEYGAYQA